MNSISRIIAASGAVAFAQPAFAMGDPFIVYWIGAGVVVHATVALVGLMHRMSRGARLPILSAYALFVILIWAWAGLSRPFVWVGLIFVLAPCVAFGIFVWIARVAATRSLQNTRA